MEIIELVKVVHRTERDAPVYKRAILSHGDAAGLGFRTRGLQNILSVRDDRTL